MYRPVGSTSAYSASTTSSPEPNTSIPDQPRQANDSTSESEREREGGSKERLASEIAGDVGGPAAAPTPSARQQQGTMGRRTGRRVPGVQ
jgi:hypothetical protein